MRLSYSPFLIASLAHFARAANDTIRGVSWDGSAFNVSVHDFPRPVILNSTDAIVRITSAAICGSDLHFYRGTGGGAPAPRGLGHEAIGYVDEVGDAVTSLQVGDAVVIPFTKAEGHVHTGLTEHIIGGYGETNVAGMQSPYIRVTFADYGLIPVPGFNVTNPATNQTEDIELDLLLLSDIFATGWTAIDYSGFQAGDTVAIFGAGPVGLLAAYSAILRGASKVYSVDDVPTRLEVARSIGAIPINFADSDPVQQIMALEPDGVTRSVDCVGYEAVNRNGTTSADTIITNMLGVTSRGGGLGTVGVYNMPGPNTEASPRRGTIPETIPFPIATFFNNELSWQGGISNPIDLAPELLQLILSGRARPSFVFSKTISIEDAPQAYDDFNDHLETKIVIRF